MELENCFILEDDRMKRKLSILLSFVLLFALAVPAAAEENQKSDTEWYELVEEDFELTEDTGVSTMPRTRYLVNVYTYITKISSGKVGMRADVYCSDTVAKIETTLTLQKLVNGKWTGVGSMVVSTTDDYQMSKSVTASNVSAGTYRAKSVTKVTAYTGYSETLTVYTGSITMS